jgi:hypothetical protein
LGYVESIQVNVTLSVQVYELSYGTNVAQNEFINIIQIIQYAEYLLKYEGKIIGRSAV